MSLLAPVWLVLLALCALPWLRPVRDRRHAALRTLVFALLALGLARPVLFGEDDIEHHVLVLDVSQSTLGGDPAMAEEVRTRRMADAAAFERALPRGARLTTVLIGADGGPSSVSSALAAADRAIPDGASGAITLVSDGQATDLRHGPVVARLSRRGTPVHVRDVWTWSIGPEDLSRPVGLDADGTLRVGQTARLRAVLAGRRVGGSRGSSGPGGSLPQIDVHLTGPGGELARATVAVPESRTEVPLEFEPQVAGFIPLTVQLGDDGPSYTRTFAVQAPLRVLHVGGRVRDGGPRLTDLLGRGFVLDEAPTGDDTALPDVAGYDLVVLDDRPADTVPDTWQQSVVDAVTDRGLGLVMTGGPGSFGPGGWHDTTIASALPVECAQKEEKRDPSTTLAIIIDTSGSMSGGRVQLAKEVSRLAIRRLLPHDKVGIVEFYGSKRWAAPIQPASNRIELQRALNRLNAGGGTVILPAIEEAYYGMQNVQTRYKHVLVLTDGGVERGAFEPLIRKMADEGMNVSTVLIGAAAHSDFLVSIANWGKGRFYSVPNRFNLPELLLKQPTTARLPAYRPGTYPVRARGGAGWWGSVDPSAAPPLSGYVETRERDGALVLMETADAGHPVVASWRHGLGRVTVMTTEPVGPGTEQWSEWDDYGRALARVLERTARDADAEFSYALRRDDDVVTLTARRNAPGDAVPFYLQLNSRGEALLPPLPLTEIAPGLFEAGLGHEPAEELRLIAGTRDAPPGETNDLGAWFRRVSSAREDVAPELQVDPDDDISLGHVAEATGGTIVRDLASFLPTVGGGTSPHGVTELRPLLLLLALLAYLADILHRRTDPEVAA